jgi:hypothetical protein
MLQVLHNQLDTQIAGLRAQLMVAEEELRRPEDMLRRALESWPGNTPITTPSHRIPTRWGDGQR